jgi:hypothetical protein
MNGLILGLVLVVFKLGLSVRTGGCPPFISKTPNPRYTRPRRPKLACGSFAPRPPQRVSCMFGDGGRADGT